MEISTLMNKICLLKPTLEMYVLRYPLDAEVADQLVQDTLIKALLEADSYKDDMPIKHWLLSLMKEKYNERDYVPMRIVHNGFKDGAQPGFLNSDALQKKLLETLNGFDADLLDHEQQLSENVSKIKEA
ncbi:hypothetical protein ACXZ1K_00885 [Pedobacter sp. PWIIR3]